MADVDKESVFKTVSELLTKMLGDWEYAGELTSETLLVADLGLESLDVVVLGETIQKHYDAAIPFARFLADIGQQEVRDICVGEFVEFVHQHLNSNL